MWTGAEAPPPDGSDDHIALGFAVVADALYAVDLSQLVNNAPVLPAHGWETVAALRLLALQSVKSSIFNNLI